MDHGKLLEQLKQGEPVAIATLLNRYLEPKGVKAQAALQDSRLHLVLESPQSAPNQDVYTAYIQHGVVGIKEIAGWSNDRFSCIVLFGRQLDKKRPTWTTTIPFSDNQYLRKRVLIHKHRQSKQSQISEPSGTPSTPPSPTSNSFRFEDKASPWVVSDEVLNLPILPFLRSVVGETEAFKGEISPWDVSDESLLSPIPPYPVSVVEETEAFKGEISPWDVSDESLLSPIPPYPVSVVGETEAFKGEISPWDVSDESLLSPIPPYPVSVVGETEAFKNHSSSELEMGLGLNLSTQSQLSVPHHQGEKVSLTSDPILEIDDSFFDLESTPPMGVSSDADTYSFPSPDHAIGLNSIESRELSSTSSLNSVTKLSVNPALKDPISDFFGEWDDSPVRPSSRGQVSVIQSPPNGSPFQNPLTPVKNHPITDAIHNDVGITPPFSQSSDLPQNSLIIKPANSRKIPALFLVGGIVSLLTFYGTVMHRLAHEQAEKIAKIKESIGVISKPDSFNRNSIKQLETARDRLEQAVARLNGLDTIPGSEFHVKQLLKKVKMDLVAIENRLSREKEASQNLIDANRLGQEALQAIQTSSTLNERLDALEKWQSAIRILSSIPNDTLVADEAQGRLKIYQFYATQTEIDNQLKLTQ